MNRAEIPVTETGVEVEQKSLIWVIKNLPVVLKQDSIINSQKMEITAGDRIGQPSKWTVFLKAEKKDERNCIGIYYRLKEAPTPKPEYLYSQIHFSIVGNKGKATWSAAETDIRDMSDPNLNKGWGFSMIDINRNAGRKRLEIHITLKLYGPPNPNCLVQPQVQVQEILDQFQDKFSAKVRKDMAALLQNPVSGGDIKVVSSDKQKEFTVARGILAARSPVFDAMLRSDMTEAKDGVIRISDLGGKSLEILLNFIYTGELLPDWKESQVVVELTNAAAKYQLDDLLEFLSLVLGKVCDLDNVTLLLNLSKQLGLQSAEEELMKFVREKGTSSAQNFYQIMDVASAMGALQL